MKDEFYRPQHIEFEVAHDGTNMPENLGTFETADEVNKFLGTSFTAINQAITVSRHMDQVEKTNLRKEYNEIFENELPTYERNWAIASNELTEAKRKEKSLGEIVSVTIDKAKGLAYEVRRGLKEMNLDDMYTYRIPYKNRYYFYTYIDKALRLCAIRDIPEQEKGEIWNVMAKNDEVIDANFGK